MKTGLYFTGGPENELATEYTGGLVLDIRSDKSVSISRNLGEVAPQDLVHYGLASPLDPDVLPNGKRSTGKVVRTVSGVPKWVHALEDTPPLYANADEAKSAMVEWVNAFNESVTGKVPNDEKLSWTHKEQAARAVVAGTADAQQIATIADEAALTGETEADLAALIITKADLYHLAVRKVAGLRRATGTALEAVTDPYDYETVLAGAQAQAADLAAQLGL